VRVLLNHSGRRSSNPHVVVFVEEAAVKARIQQLRVTPGVDDGAVAVELDD
jgi:hypothetical protein